MSATYSEREMLHWQFNLVWQLAGCHLPALTDEAHPRNEPRPLRLLLAWANCELMKNVGKIGAVRHLFAAAHHSG